VVSRVWRYSVEFGAVGAEVVVGSAVVGGGSVGGSSGCSLATEVVEARAGIGALVISC
jgi:hypothetical protein